MEIQRLPSLPYTTLNVQYLLSVCPIRDRILRLIFPYDIYALYRALDWDLDGETADYYSRFWYDNAGVSVVSQSQVASQKAILCSYPYYYGQDVLTELPKVTASWLESAEIDPAQMVYRRLNIEGHASVGSVSFIIEERGKCCYFNPLDIIKPLSSLHVWLSNGKSNGEAETRTLGWITSDRWKHDRAAREILEELRLAIRYMYGEKGYSQCGHSEQPPTVDTEGLK